jgi:hypothetical protein
VSIPAYINPSAARRLAFSLVEIVVAVGLLSFIILGLLMMFDQTQKAFRLSITQADVLEQGRATLDMMSREVEQTAPSQYPDWLAKGGAWYRTTNFFAQMIADTNYPAYVTPLVQPLLGTPPSSRTNQIQQFFFLTKLNQDWVGTGYLVKPDTKGASVGTLYRYCVTNWRSAPITSAEVIARAFTNPDPNVIVSRIAEGVVHLRARAFDTNGFLIPATAGWFGASRNIWSQGNALEPQVSCYFVSNALPAYVELELGILEAQIVKKSRSIPNPTLQSNFLSGYAAEAHVFRQRIPIRNVDTTAYQ